MNPMLRPCEDVFANGGAIELPVDMPIASG